MSKYTDNFIIKGGFLVTAMTKIDLRTTMDLDITLKSLTLSEEELKKILKDIIKIPTHQLLTMKLSHLEDIHENANYPGLRATINVTFDGIKERIKVDFTTGDILTPSDIQMHHYTLLDNKALILRSYNIETVLAEKLETILSRGILNTRMKDYYDVYILTTLKKDEVDLVVLKEALANTMKSRKTYELNNENYIAIVKTINQDLELERLWQNYQVSYPYAKGISWGNIIAKITNILEI